MQKKLTDLEKLIRAATKGNATRVETALGRFEGEEALKAAEAALDAARGKSRWDNVAYLADFLDDVGGHQDYVGGGDDDSVDSNENYDGGSHDSDDSRDSRDSMDIMQHVIEGGAKKHTPKVTWADEKEDATNISDIMMFVVVKDQNANAISDSQEGLSAEQP